MSEKEEMKSDMVRDLASLLMDRDPGLSMDQALGMVFNSETYQKLLEDKTRLYYQSAGYVFSYLQQELETGKIG
ncbi:hypothetical protein C7120_07290 [Prevotella sp. oral taxon 376]|uniref:hypothetical protein n=1 Tax=Prevotella sp. oral taxon 376 TaxID=712466 RepID=UPI000D1D8A54|nr:hypothetical protein [Prevotella sp. oral taxon 376]PTL34329.1 hypothetical protein C7120_07290 [Prevotella sp. oral taxon 376]